jgi:beta-1,4-galactosyltransferase 1
LFIFSNRIFIEGGYWKPEKCISNFKIAIIIPYRDRLPHLKVLLYYLHLILQRQQLDYKIFVVEPNTPLNIRFNKGRVMNAAFLEALKVDNDINCFIFHDVDLVPEDDRILYSCPSYPRHLSVAIDKFDYILPYENLVGGVFAISKQHYLLVNGYSNNYWGWGAEGNFYF